MMSDRKTTSFKIANQKINRMLESPPARSRRLASALAKPQLERQRASWARAKRAQRQRERDGEAIAHVRYDAQRIEFVIRNGYEADAGGFGDGLLGAKDRPFAAQASST
jgi:hypothetical protein